jgi:hypothetical protein
MPIARDFRLYAFQIVRVERCGRSVGRNLFWKLYTVENSLRIVIHSVLTVQLAPNWWGIAVGQRKQAQLANFRADYTSRPQHASPGAHDIYLLYLSDLTKMLATFRTQFLPVVPDVDQWVVRLENIRLPRNLVGHMNFPNAFDRQRIDLAYSALPALFNQLTTTGIPILIP